MSGTQTKRGYLPPFLCRFTRNALQQTAAAKAGQGSRDRMEARSS